MVFPSREKVLCGYPGCAYNGQRRAFRRHNMLVHGGRPVQLRNGAFGAGGRWRAWVGSGK